MTTKSHNLGDALLSKTLALPATNNTVTQAAGIDLESTTTGVMLADVVVEVEAPAVAVGLLSDGATLVYDIIASSSADLSSPTVIGDNVITQTGAGGVGASGVTIQHRLPPDCKTYVGIRITSDTIIDASAATATCRLQF